MERGRTGWVVTSGLGRDVRWLLAGQTASAIGTGTSILVLPLLALSIRGSAVDAGMVGLVNGATALLCRLPGGRAADRFDRRTLMVACNGLLATVGLLAAVAVYAGLGGSALLGVVVLAAAAEGAGSAWFSPAETSALRTLVPPELLPRALSMQQGRAALALLAGPVIGGALFVHSPALALLFDAATSLVGALACAAIRTPLTAEPGAPSDVRRITDGVRFVLSHPVLRYASLSGAVLNLVFNGLFLLVVALMAGSGRSALGTGLSIAVIGVGMLVGAIVAGPAVSAWPGRGAVVVSTAVCATSVGALAVVPIGWMAAALAVAAATGPPVSVAVGCVQMAVTPAELQGRVSSGVGLVAGAAGPLGPALAGLGIAAIGGRSVLVVAAALVTLVALAGLVVRFPSPEPAHAVERAEGGAKIS